MNTGPEEMESDEPTPCPKLRSKVSLNMEGGELAKNLSLPLSPIEYQFLLRRPSLVTEEQVEVG